MESTVIWTVAVLAGVGLIAIIFGMAVLISLWWLIVPVIGALWGGWLGLAGGIAIVVVLTAAKKVGKRR